VNKMKDAFTYHGKVKISYKINGKTYEIPAHNLGTQNLFKFLCRSLCGANVINDRPIQIDIRTSTQSSFLYSESILIDKLAVSTTYIDDISVGWMAKFTAELKYNNLNMDISPLEQNYFRLYLQNSSEEDFAYVGVDYLTLAQLQAGTQLQIDWCLYFDNIGQQS